MATREELIDFYGWLEYQYRGSKEDEEDFTIGEVIDRYILSSQITSSRKVKI